MKNGIFKFFVFAVLIIMSFISVIYCFYDTGQPESYKYLYLLPVSFGISNLILFFAIVRGNILLDIPTIIIISLMFLRNVITPFVMTTDSYYSSLGIPYFNHANMSIALIVYETITVYIFVAIYKFRWYKGRYKLKNKKTFIHSDPIIFKTVFWGALCICIMAVLIIPEIRTQYYTIFTSDITYLVQQEAHYSVGTVKRIIATSGDILIGVMRVILSSVLIYQFRRKQESLAKLFLSLILVFAQCLFMNDSNAYIMMIMISQIVFIYKLYPKYQKFIWKTVIFTGITFFLVLYLNRFATDHYGKSISLFLQSYIPSVANTAGIFRLSKEHSIRQIFTDFFIAIPFKSTFGYSGSAISLSTLWNIANGVSGQILPTIGQSFYYFGFVFSPLLSCCFIYISYTNFNKMKDTNNAVLYAVYVYFMIYSAATPFVYNGVIFMQALLQRIIFMLIIAKLAPYTFEDLNLITEASASLVRKKHSESVIVGRTI